MKPILSLNLVLFLLMQIWSGDSVKVTSIEVPGDVMYFDEYEELGAYINGWEYSLYLYEIDSHCVVLVRHAYFPLAVVHLEGKCPPVTQLQQKLSFVQERGTYKMGIWEDRAEDQWTMYSIPRNLSPIHTETYKLDKLDNKRVPSTVGADWTVDKTWRRREVKKKVQPPTGAGIRGPGPTVPKQQIRAPITAGSGFQDTTAVQIQPKRVLVPKRPLSPSKSSTDDNLRSLSDRRAIATRRIVEALQRIDATEERNGDALERIAKAMEVIAKSYKQPHY